MNLRCLKKIILSLCILCFWHYLFSSLPNNKIDAKSQATPLASKIPVPSNLSLKFLGEVKYNYLLTSTDLSKLPAVKIRTKEVSSEGKTLGTYIYHGIPVYHILEGIAPRKNKGAPFDRPLDLVVSFISRDGRESRFSYCELTMTDDNTPVILAYHRAQLLPTKNPKAYTKNHYKDNISGLRLICPGDLYDSRYLDEVVAVRFFCPPTTDHLLPAQSKGKKCSSKILWCIENGKIKRSSLYNILQIVCKNWFRTGHGRGIKSSYLEKATGYSLRQFISLHFNNCNSGDFFLFTACDGYRALLSWREIFQTVDGSRMILTIRRNSDNSIQDIRLACVADFFVDRNIWGLSHIERIIL